MGTAQQLIMGGSGVAGVVTTWNPSDKGAGGTLSNGNLTFVGNTSNGWARATTSHSTTGKFYYEVKIDVDGSANQAPQVGVQLGGAANGNNKIGSVAGLGWSIQTSSGFTWDNSTNSATGVNFAVNDIIAVAVDFGASKIWWAINNTWIASGNPSAGTSPRYSDIAGTLFPAISAANATGTYTARFRIADFTYTMPTGFSSWQGN